MEESRGIQRSAWLALEAALGGLLATHATLFLLAACRHLGSPSLDLPSLWNLPWDTLRLTFALSAAFTSFLVVVSVGRTLSSRRRWVLSLAIGSMLGAFCAFVIARNFAWWQSSAEVPEIPWATWLSGPAPLRASLFSVPIFTLWQAILLRGWCEAADIQKRGA